MYYAYLKAACDSPDGCHLNSNYFGVPDMSGSEDDPITPLAPPYHTGAFLQVVICLVWILIACGCCSFCCFMGAMKRKA